MTIDWLRIFCFLFLLAVAAPVAQATPPLISICKVEGVIQEVQFEKEWHETCALEGAEYPCPTDAPIFRPEGYWVTVKTEKVVPVEDTSWNWCDDGKKKHCAMKVCLGNYPLGKESKIFAVREKMSRKKEKQLKPGKEIRGVVESVSWPMLISFD